MKSPIVLIALFTALSATAPQTAGAQWIDVLDYVFPNRPNGNTSSVISNHGNPWRTFSNSGSVGERLSGFYITKGNVEFLPDRAHAYNFEQMIYDHSWIYLVRDTSWTSTCKDNGHVAGMLLFTYENGQWLRGGRHFPRWIQNGHTKSTGSKYIQGVERKDGPGDNGAQEGRWCNAHYSGWTSSDVRADLLGGRTVGGTYFSDVLQLSITGGSGNGDSWWFARGTGLIKFGDGSIAEEHDDIVDPYEVIARVPCWPNAPCM
ncbi:MAG: hypothetical protein AAGD06_33575 [Acidobacteriota bacterium]